MAAWAQTTPPTQPQASVDAGATGVGNDAGATSSADAGTSAETKTAGAGAVPLDVKVEIEVDGGATISAWDPTSVPPEATFHITLEPRLETARVRLLDGSARQVPASAAVTVDAHTRVQLTPTPGLKTGTDYRLVVEPDTNEGLRDPHGRSFAPAELRFHTAGEPVRSKSKTKKRRH